LIVGGIALLAAVPSAGAPKRPRAPPAATPAPNCDAHKFETTIEQTVDGQPTKSTVRMCGVAGQSDAEWIVTLQDAVKKTEASTRMPIAAKEQIVAAVNAEIERLSHPGAQLPEGGDISKLPRAPARVPEAAPLARDYGSLAPLPAAPEFAPPRVIGPGASLALRLTVGCATPGFDDRPDACDDVGRNTVLVVRADDALPAGIELRFVREGDIRAMIKLGPMRIGQRVTMRLPFDVCRGARRGKLQIEARDRASPANAPATPIAEFSLRC
jgi:hypothetical protein